jgi:hypothetical protein
MSGQRTTPIRRDLLDLAARYSVGGFINDVDDVLKRHTGRDVAPASVHRACMALHVMLADLGITDGSKPLAADIWRSVDA